MVRLKPGQEAFEIVDGPGAGLKFQRGKAYDEKIIPKTETWRFEPVPKPVAKPKEVKPPELKPDAAKPAAKPMAKKEASKS